MPCTLHAETTQQHVRSNQAKLDYCGKPRVRTHVAAVTVNAACVEINVLQLKHNRYGRGRARVDAQLRARKRVDMRTYSLRAT